MTTSEEFYEEAAKRAALEEKDGASVDPWPDAARVEFRPPVGADPFANPASDTEPYAAGWSDPSINDVAPYTPDDGVNPAQDVGPYARIPFDLPPVLTAAEEARRAALEDTDEDRSERRRAAFGRSDDHGLNGWDGGGPTPSILQVQASIGCPRCGSLMSLAAHMQYACRVCGHIENVNDPTAEVTPDGEVYDGDNPESDTAPYGAARPEAGERTGRIATAVHTFGSTSEAYDASQTRDDIHDGDVLSVPKEGVHGFLYQAWPIAVTEQTGMFHSAKDMDALLADEPKYRDSHAKASELAGTG